ncbi:hypothetical protein ABIE12_003308 [Serratia sp. 509]
MINTVKRRELIIDQLCLEGTVRVEQLSSQFAVSTVTIRSDLHHLEKVAAQFALTVVPCSTSRSPSIVHYRTRAVRYRSCFVANSRVGRWHRSIPSSCGRG